MQTPEDVLFEVEQALVKQGHPKLDAETLKEAYKHLTNPQVLQQIQAGQLTPQHIAEQVGQALQVVQARRKPKQAGLLREHHGLPPLGNSRIYGDAAAGGEGFQYQQLPAPIKPGQLFGNKITGLGKHPGDQPLLRNVNRRIQGPI